MMDSIVHIHASESSLDEVTIAAHMFPGGDTAGATSERATPCAAGHAVRVCSRISAGLAFLRPGCVRVSRQKPRVSPQYIAAGASRTTPLEQTRLPALCEAAQCRAFVPPRPPPWTWSSAAPATGATWGLLSGSLCPLVHGPSLFICPSGGLCRWLFVNALSPAIAFDSVRRPESVA